MPPYFTRLKFAFRTFFSILDRGRIADDVLETLGGPPAAAPAAVRQPAAVQPAPRAADDVGRAVQMLALLQRDGRLIDFLMEDVTTYADAQIGAAVRNVHAGCRSVLQEYLTLASVFPEDEGATVTVGPDADAATVKVIGNAAAPPFRGILRHKGWVISRIDLPPAPAAAPLVVAPAEVEIP